MPRPYTLALVILMLPLVAGCAHEHIPTYPPMGDDQAITILHDRAQAIHTISAQALVTLTRSNGESVRLDAAVALQPPERARLRAWKFGQAVFDVTVTPQGLWLIVSRNDEHHQELLTAGSNAGKLIRQWLGLMTGSFEGDARVVGRTSRTLQLQQPGEDGTTLECILDLKTLTPRRYAVRDRAGAERFSLVLSHYAEIGPTVWPRRIEAVSESGRIAIDLHDVEINSDLPPGAFHPPARAVKLP
jgi:hypothetical protein